ncbi:hypothetical protein PFISCL1PPCAC_7516 [Pristionchus fissidentatus]|uniref:Protein kinase domain-containing protein n=1 Tax=Pristionchus fissidentatus TaxID=1538716 RepID=A0AAV5V9W5_9BILA|nr:hypothetical protein PFISCL1PPCAC_7516 [Pristionchus fissidentatus]
MARYRKHLAVNPLEMHELRTSNKASLWMKDEESGISQDDTESSVDYNEQEITSNVHSRFAEDFRVRKVLAKSGFGVIYEAVHLLTARVYAVIIMKMRESQAVFVNSDTGKGTDFYVATNIFTSTGGGDNDEEERTHTCGVGTYLYMASEQKFWRYSSKVDVFALGLITAELWVPMTNEKRYKIFENYRRDIRNDILRDQPDAETFVTWLTSVESNDRPTCTEILNSPFLAGV